MSYAETFAGVDNHSLWRSDLLLLKDTLKFWLRF
jgi:hypothetical protein